jgi:hypothetical protein
VPVCPVELRNGDVWVKTTFTRADLAAHWHQRLANGLAHDLGLVIAKAIHGQLAAGVPHADIVRQVALFGAQNRDGWGVGLTILTAVANLPPVLPEEDAYLALFHGARRVAANCDGEAPRRERAPLGSRPDPATLKRWLQRWTKVRHRAAAERTLLTAIAAGFSPAELAEQFFEMTDVVVAPDLLFHAGTPNALDHRIVIPGIRQDHAVRQQPGNTRDAGLVRYIARGEDQRRFFAVQVGEFALQFDQRMVGAGNVAGAAGASAMRVAVSTMAPITFGCWPMPR